MQKCYQEDGNMPWDEIIRRCGEAAIPVRWASRSPYLRPAGMYHTMLRQVTPYTIRGFSIIRAKTTRSDPTPMVPTADDAHCPVA